MRTIRTLVVSAVVLLLLGSCAFWGTATLYITNGFDGTEEITHLYVYPWSSDRGEDLIDDPLEPGELKVVYLVAPGPTVVEAVIYDGWTTWTAYETLVVEAGHTYMDIVFRD